jgi:hypothetical protein
MNAEQMPSAQTDLAGTASLTRHDRLILDSVDRYLAAGLQMKRWWKQAYATNNFAERFELGLTFNRPDSSFGFFAQAFIDGRNMPIMGNFQSMFYDRPKTPNEQTPEAARWLQEQLREFVLHYFMRVSDFRQPQAVTDVDRPVPPAPLRPFSICPPEDPRRIGFGFSQFFYKRRDTGEVGRFSDEERCTIVDLREIGTTYEWIVVRVRIFDFNFVYMPFGRDNPNVVLPLSEASYLALSRDFITNVDHPEPGVLGRYGVGYAFIKDPLGSLLAYGPGQFEAAIEIIDFLVHDDGRIRTDMVFISNRPQGILNVSLNPVDWGFRLADLVSFGLTSQFFEPVQRAFSQLSFLGITVDPVYGFIDLANLVTAGQAAKQLCLSRDELERQFLVKHFEQHYQTVAGALRTWRQIPDWRAGQANLPHWVVTGISS